MRKSVKDRLSDLLKCLLEVERKMVTTYYINYEPLTEYRILSGLRRELESILQQLICEQRSEK